MKTRLSLSSSFSSAQHAHCEDATAGILEKSVLWYICYLFSHGMCIQLRLAVMLLLLLGQYPSHILNQFNVFFLILSYHWWSPSWMEIPVNTLARFSCCPACCFVLMLCLWAKPKQGVDGALNEVSGFIALQSGPLTRLLRAAWHVAAAWGRRVTPEVVPPIVADFKNLSLTHRSVLTGLSWLNKWTVCKFMQMCVLMLFFCSSRCLFLYRSIFLKNTANAFGI